MDAIVEADWRWIPCLAMVVLAAVLWFRAAVQWRRVLGPERSALGHMVAFRKLVMGIGLAGMGAGWWLGSPFLFWAGFIIGLEETIESSIALVGLRLEAKELAAKEGSVSPRL